MNPLNSIVTKDSIPSMNAQEVQAAENLVLLLKQIIKTSRKNQKESGALGEDAQDEDNDGSTNKHSALSQEHQPRNKRLHSEMEDDSTVKAFADLDNDGKAKLCQNYAKEIKQLR